MAHHLCRSLGQISYRKPTSAVKIANLNLIRASTFWEKDPKSGYGRQLTWKDSPALIKDGLQDFKKGFGMYAEEIKEKFRSDVNMFDIRHLDYMYMWKFDSKEAADKWIVTTDKDNKEGKSSAALSVSSNKTAIFYGYLCQEVPKDGITKSAGYCQIRSPYNVKAFNRTEPYDWSMFNCLILKVRGDGRSYMLTLGLKLHFDINWNRQYHFPLYTRGGPYWQVIKIPFSKFYLAFKGRIQDKQEPLPLSLISFLGISIGDGNEGPFELEVDSIAVQYDENLTEEFAYELYEANPAHVGT